VVEQIAVACDDRAGACGLRERDEIVVVGITQDAGLISRIAQLDAGEGDLAHGALSVGWVDAGEEVRPRLTSPSNCGHTTDSK